MLILDTEVYSDYFLLSFLQPETGKVRHFERYLGHTFDHAKVAGLMRSYKTVSFNGLNFDLPLILLTLTGADNLTIKAMCDKIIKGGSPGWRVMRDYELYIPKGWDHIDLIDVAPGKASLKIYGGRLGAERMQDLPIPPDASIAPDQRQLLRDYCANDLHTTAALYDALRPAVELREAMSKQYGMDLRSKSDAQIAETVIRSELERLTGKRYGKPDLPDDFGFRYRDPGVVSFQSEHLRDVFERIKAHRFTLSAAGQAKMPEWLKSNPVEIAGKQYQMGIGGLHSTEKRQFIDCQDGWQLYEIDVASYYPSIILQQQLAPGSMGKPFLDVYQSIVDRRIVAKRSGDKTTADTLKIAVNGSFGKLGSRYSFLFAPELLIQTTVTGQLALLMLIERMAAAGVAVVSANTDGVVVHHPDHLSQAAEAVMWDWQLDTSYTLERTDYRAIASRDVNNYIAVKPDGKTKGKGVFASGGLMKNPNQRIVSRAVSDYIAHGTPLEQSINDCQDVREFVTVRAVKGGAVWRGQELGKAVRFYLSTEVSDDEHITYKINGNRVPKSGGARPLMDLPDECPADIGRDAYIAEAWKLLVEVGAA